MAVSSKECPECGRRYPKMCGIATCLECKAVLKVVSGSPTVDEEDYKRLSYIYGRTMPKSLPAEELIRLEREWADLDLEVGRRGSSRWSIADLIGEGFLSVRAES